MGGLLFADFFLDPSLRSDEVMREECTIDACQGGHCKPTSSRQGNVRYRFENEQED
jgi:hypothetical protein